MATNTDAGNMSTPLVLGTMYFGTRLDDRDAFALLDRFVELGGVWLDTSDNYSFWEDPSGLGGQSEALLGRWLKANPGALVKLSTKVGAQPNRPGGFPDNVEGLSERAIRGGFAGSLERLGVDHVDLLWAHVEDRSVALDETVGAFGALVGDGTIGSYGVSNHPSFVVEEICWRAANAHLPAPTAYQQRYSYLQPLPGAEVGGQPLPLGMLSSDGLELLRRRPAVEGWVYTALLLGAYDRPDRTLGPEYDHPGNARRLAALDEVATARGLTRGQVVLAWLTGGSPQLVPILGGSTVGQLDVAWEGATSELTQTERTMLDAVA